MLRSLRQRAKRGLLVLAVATPVQPAAAQWEEEAEVAGAEPAPSPSPLRRFGLAPLSRRLESEALEQRLRAMARLGELGSAAAFARLASHALERRARLLGPEWLGLARALAAGAGEEKAQLALAMLVNQAANPAAGPDEAAALELARGMAGLALAAEGSPAALLVLGRALRAPGAPARAAAAALVAHPPRSLEPLIEPGAPSPELAALLGALGDQRGFHALRGWVLGGGDDAVRAAAALALTRLGHLETVPLGARWLETGPPELAEAGLEILLAAQDPRADVVLRERLAAERVSEADRHRLLDAAGPGLEAAALAGLGRAGVGEPWRWALLGRVGGDAAARRLAQALAEPSASFAAAQALSRLPGGAAQSALAAALAERVALPASLRAAAVRERLYGERWGGLEQQVAEALRSDAPSERAAGAWVRALAGGEAAAAELRSGDEVRVAAAASHVYAFDAAALEAMVALLERSPPGRTREAASACLGTAAGRERVDSALLWELVAEAGAARPLALRALAARADPGLRPALRSLLADPDPLVRAHVARGLGDGAEPSAVGLLAARLAIETHEVTRHALVLALGAHQGHAVTLGLSQAARLDPSPRVRSAARLALAGVSLADPPPGRELLWLELRPARPGATVLLELGPGLAIPVLADPAGAVVVAGLPAPAVGIRLQ